MVAVQCPPVNNHAELVLRFFSKSFSLFWQMWLLSISPCMFSILVHNARLQKGNKRNMKGQNKIQWRFRIPIVLFSSVRKEGTIYTSVMSSITHTSHKSLYLWERIFSAHYASTVMCSHFHEWLQICVSQTPVLLTAKTDRNQPYIIIKTSFFQIQFFKQTVEVPNISMGHFASVIATHLWKHFLDASQCASLSESSVWHASEQTLQRSCE